ncbi:Adenylyltransferase and sulfurtransferase UBA4 [Hondaea fermentalgiana]|uniref:Adenylyltransferase and sulfurtransferase UBA4 n=1 Tax=Hondaea fermentalgiana TaxID=2315210 RepID=A0A2R5GUS8_9STRA|nr:Adenylyltransferase and sulfurtransferase UBA4 [Hondaea fermentalgiana]|eukprot:GBG34616.1 Adenylyltransferase and sulfurtransferase UBA4 [Hondaea fermentalgiana]
MVDAEESSEDTAQHATLERARFEVAKEEDVLAWVKRLECKIKELEFAARMHKNPDVIRRVQELDLEKLERFANKSKTRMSEPENNSHSHVRPLQPKTVILVGAGDVGSFIAEGLARAGIGKLGILDDKVVTEACLAKSCFRREHIGLAQAAAARSLAHDLSYSSSVCSITDRITNCKCGLELRKELLKTPIALRFADVCLFSAVDT